MPLTGRDIAALELLVDLAVDGIDAIDTEPQHITDYCQQTVEVHGRPHTCARLNDHSGKHQVAVPQVGLVKW